MMRLLNFKEILVTHVQVHDSHLMNCIGVFILTQIMMPENVSDSQIKYIQFCANQYFEKSSQTCYFSLAYLLSSVLTF